MDLKETEYESVKWMHGRQTTSLLKDGNDSSGPTTCAELLCQMGTGFARNLFNSVNHYERHPHVSRVTPMKNKQTFFIHKLPSQKWLNVFILADRHSEMEILSLSFNSPSRNKCYVMNWCLTDTTALDTDIPHRSVSCEHFDVADVDFIVAYYRMHLQITTDRHVTSNQSLTFPIALRLHRPLQDSQTRA